MSTDWRSEISGECDGETFTWLGELSLSYLIGGGILLIFLLLPLVVIALHGIFHRETSVVEAREECDKLRETEDFWEKDGLYVYNVAGVLKKTDFIDLMLATSNVSELSHQSHPRASGFKVDVETQTDPTQIYDEDSTMGSSGGFPMDNTPSSREEKVPHVAVGNQKTQSSHSKDLRPAKKLHRWKGEGKERPSAVHAKERTATAKASTERASNHYHRSSTTKGVSTDQPTRRSNDSMRLKKTQESSSIKGKAKKK